MLVAGVPIVWSLQGSSTKTLNPSDAIKCFYAKPFGVFPFFFLPLFQRFCLTSPLQTETSN